MTLSIARLPPIAASRSSPAAGLDLAAMRGAALRLAALGHKRGDAAAVLRGMIGRAAGRRGASVLVFPSRW